MNKVVSTKLIATLVLVAIALIGAAHAQTLPIAERVQPKYQITTKVPEHSVTVTLVMNERVNNGTKMEKMRDFMAYTVKKNCSKQCDGIEADRVREKVMREALRNGIKASHVLFE